MVRLAGGSCALRRLFRRGRHVGCAASPVRNRVGARYTRPSFGRVLCDRERFSARSSVARFSQIVASRPSLSVSAIYNWLVGWGAIHSSPWRGREAASTIGQEAVPGPQLGRRTGGALTVSTPTRWVAFYGSSTWITRSAALV